VRITRWRTNVRLATAGLAAAVALVATCWTPLAVAAAPPVAAAADGPGALSHFDLARKDCIGTARSTMSKVWYTIAGGVLSDVYFPTADNTNVETLQLVVTDGSTFTDLQSRDTTYTTALLDERALDCRVTSTAKSGRYRIVSDYVTDPSRNTLLVRVRFEALIGMRSAYHVYARFDPNLNGNGGGGAANAGGDSGGIDSSAGHAVLVGSDPVTTTNAANRDYGVPVFSALDASTPFTEVSNGFAGQASDGLTQLQADHRLTALFGSAVNGNLVQTARLDLSHDGEVTLALGLGTSQQQAVGAAEASLTARFDRVRRAFEEGWESYDSGLRRPPRIDDVRDGARATLADQWFLDANLIKSVEDKTFPGAIGAAPASPWGQAVSAGDPANTYFGSYREVFARDLYETWTGLIADGDQATARDAVLFLFDRQQQADGSLPRNSLLNGRPAPDTFNVQLDESSYPILMARTLGMTDAALFNDHISGAANFVISHGPSFGPERWEEQSGFSPSTIAAEVAGLVAAAAIADANGQPALAAVYRGVADDWQRSVEGWTVTTNGPLAAHPYFIRLSKTGDPNAAISYNVGNGGPTLDQRTVIDQGFLELVRLGLLPANDPAVTASLPVVDATIGTVTPSGQGFHRYNGDGYGDGSADGHPWAPSGRGTGHPWPLLTQERGEYALASGQPDTALSLLDTMRRFASGVGLIPEQDWELPDLAASPPGTDPTVASIGFANGHPAGSAAPLMWATGSALRLQSDIAAGTLLDRPADTFQRYVAHRQGQTALTLSAPTDGSLVSASPVTVAGATAPGNTVYVAVTAVDNRSKTTVQTVRPAADGTFSVQVNVSGGSNAINAVAVAPDGATAHAERSVFFDVIPGKLLLDVADPSGDDHGPGNYAYPTASDFHPGAYDIQEFQVVDSGQTVTFRLRTGDLTPTFGSPLGAQLVDVYVHDPAAAPADTTTAASFPQRNYAIAPASAWNRLIEVQGFGQRYVDAHGATVGTVAISANSISRVISFSVPKASLGTPATGWTFTVVLTGQDGFSSDQARGFTATPQPFQFGVCASASSDPHCTVDPATVPKAMDVLTPPGVLQSDELDYTAHRPITLQGVPMP
jgi:glucoamylase